MVSEYCKSGTHQTEKIASIIVSTNVLSIIDALTAPEIVLS